MNDASLYHRRYLLAAGLGAMAGGVLVAVATRAIPGMMSHMMSNMMQNMMARLEARGCDPAQM
jgi:hypothetical protein